MKAARFYELPEGYRQVVELPSDLMIMPLTTTLETPCETKVAHSDHLSKWYILIYLSAPVPEFPDIDTWLYASGSWTEVANCLDLNHIYAPFKWGVPIPAQWGSGTHFYIPYWESVPTGEYDEEDCEIYEEKYTLVSCITTRLETDNPQQHNGSTCFEVYQYDSIIDIARHIESVTGIKF